MSNEVTALVHVSDAWLHVRGTVEAGYLRYNDRNILGKPVRGFAAPGDWIHHFPRKLSDKERGKKRAR